MPRHRYKAGDTVELLVGAHQDQLGKVAAVPGRAGILDVRLEDGSVLQFSPTEVRPSQLQLPLKDESLIDRAVRVAQETVQRTGGDFEQVAEIAALAAIKVVAHDLRAMLYPELYPGYDPDHVYWDGKDPATFDPDNEEPFQWSADIPEWVGTWAEQLVQELGDE